MFGDKGNPPEMAETFRFRNFNKSPRWIEVVFGRILEGGGCEQRGGGVPVTGWGNPTDF